MRLMERNCDSRASLFSLRLNFPFCHITILHLMCHSHKNSRVFFIDIEFFDEYQEDHSRPFFTCPCLRDERAAQFG